MGWQVTVKHILGHCWDQDNPEKDFQRPFTDMENVFHWFSIV